MLSAPALCLFYSGDWRTSTFKTLLAASLDFFDFDSDGWVGETHFWERLTFFDPTPYFFFFSPSILSAG